MNLYTCEFEGHYPVGSAAIVFANDMAEARVLINKKLEAAGLPQSEPVEIKYAGMPWTSEPVAMILFDGNY